MEGEVRKIFALGHGADAGSPSSDVTGQSVRAKLGRPGFCPEVVPDNLFSTVLRNILARYF